MCMCVCGCNGVVLKTVSVSAGTRVQDSVTPLLCAVIHWNRLNVYDIVVCLYL